MNSVGKKNWCILIYANGNNELEPEMWQVKQLAEIIGSDENVHVVLQLGREDRKLVNFFRPDARFPEPSESWTGVRRYYVVKRLSLLQEDLGSINMAHPVTLYEFLKWAMTSYPAQQYMLILGGHGYQFVGAMTDYSQDQPCIMGIPGINKSIEMACSEIGCKIDLLILDICYFNFIEVMYELGQSESPAVLNALTYIVDGPINGLPVDQIIQMLQQNTLTPVRQFTCKVIDNLANVNLVAVEINHSKLESIKHGFHQLACTYLTNSDKELSMLKLLQCSNPDMPWYPIAKSIIRNMASIIIHFKRSQGSHQSLINVASFPSGAREKIELYSKLAFAKDNEWTFMLSYKTRLEQEQQGNDFEPVALKSDAVLAYISTMNKHKSMDEIKRIFHNLVSYKGWVV